MQNLIDLIKSNLSKENLQSRSKKARDWLRRNLKTLRVIQKNILSATDALFVGKIIIGKMYFFSYDPKTKETLPFYDQFPLVIPIEKYSDGFLGLNLHYISPTQRIALLSKLYALLNNKNFNETTKLRISYDILSGASRFKEFAPCVKRYLYPHLRSKIIEIPPSDWEIAVFLPTERFVGATSAKVQRLSAQEF